MDVSGAVAHLALWTVVGLTVGVLGSWTADAWAWDGALINVAVTILGAALATSLVWPLPGAMVEPEPEPTPQRNIDMATLIVAVAGGVAVLLLVHLVRRGLG